MNAVLKEIEMSGEGAGLESRVGTLEADGRHIRSDMQRSERTS